MTAINPGGDLPPAAVHPCSRAFANRHNTLQEYAELLNRVQRHICMAQYCQRRDKITKQVRCRFAFPWPEQETPGVGNHSNPAYRTFEPARNDSMLGKHNALVSLAWLANTDFAPCTDEKSVIHYLAKYTSKEEKKSEKLADVGKSILNNLPDNAPMLTWMTRLYNKMISERDWSAQEVCHLLLDRHLRDSSRQVADLDTRPNDVQRRRLNMSSVVSLGDTWIERYCARDESLDDTSLMNTMRCYRWERKAFRDIGNPRVLNLYPRPNQTKDYGEWCRVKIMLHHPFRRTDLSDTVY